MIRKTSKLSRRKVLTLSLITSGAALSALPARWSKPVLSSIVLPAHAQTSANMCMTDTTVGGPLLGNPSGATTCQAACEVEASDRGAQLCDVNEFVDSSGATQCDCDLDLP